MPTAGHPGIVKTTQQIAKDYWWPEMRKFMQKYVRGCGICQQNKAIMHPNNPPLNPIFSNEKPEPFKTISIDLITKLPQSNRYDLILTVTDQGTTKAVILIPCKETMSAEDLAQEYKDKAFCYVLSSVRLSFSFLTCDPSTLPNHFPSPDSYLGHQCAGTVIVLLCDSF